MTPLDRAHAAMQGDERAQDAGRLRFYQCLADCELFVLLEREATQETISPDVFEVADGRFVLAFDSPERLAEFTGRVAPYAAMSGRVLAQMLDRQDIGLAVNLQVAPSSILFPPDAVAWLNRTLGQVPGRVEAKIDGFSAPEGLPGTLIAALRQKLLRAAGLMQAAWLVGVRYEGGGTGHLLGFVGAPEAVQDALAKAAGEALTFTGVEAAAMDVGFFAVDDPVVVRLAACGISLDLPPPDLPPEPHREQPRPAPGSDPDKPPILR